MARRCDKRTISNVATLNERTSKVEQKTKFTDFRKVEKNRRTRVKNKIKVRKKLQRCSQTALQFQRDRRKIGNGARESHEATRISPSPGSFELRNVIRAHVRFARKNDDNLTLRGATVLSKSKRDGKKETRGFGSRDAPRARGWRRVPRVRTKSVPRSVSSPFPPSCDQWYFPSPRLGINERGNLSSFSVVFRVRAADIQTRPGGSRRMGRIGRKRALIRTDTSRLATSGGGRW